MTEPDDRYGDALRRALRAEADRVSPHGDGLERIRARTARRPRAWWQPALVALSAAAVVGVGAGAAYTVFQQDGDPGRVGIASTDSPTSEGAQTVEASPKPVESEPSQWPDASPTTSPTGLPPRADAPFEVFVYYVADTGNDRLGLRLFRELRNSAPAPDRLTAAVETMLSPPLDPDYSSLWSTAEMELLDPVEVEGDTATVNVTKGKVTLDIEADAAEKAIQQLVYTVTASGKEWSVKQVRLLVEGEEVSQLFGYNLTGEQPLTRAPRDVTQSINWILSPQEGATVPTTFQIKGYGTYNEGNANWQILQGDTVVKQGFETTTASMGVFDSWISKPITLDPGTYTVRTVGAFAEGDGGDTFVDTKTITVE